MVGISNVTIEEFIEEENDDFQRNFACDFCLIERLLF